MTDRISQSLETYLDLLSARQNLVASNIANLDTPGYRTRDIDFQSELQSALSAPRNFTQTGGYAPGTARAIVPREVGGLQVKNDGNDVSLEREARLLGENAMRFEMASAMLSGRMRMIRLAIKEGNLG